MTTAPTDSLEVGGTTRSTQFEELASPSASFDVDVRRMRSGFWEPTGDSSDCSIVYPILVDGYADDIGELVYVEPELCGEDTLLLQLHRLHRELAPITQGTVRLRFFQVALYDAFERVLAARARDNEVAVEVTHFHGGATQPARAWTTFEELSRWLGIGKVRTATVLGISRGTTNAWKAGGEPQPRNARRLYRTHAVVKTLVRRLGVEATRVWLETGDPSPLDLLSSADFTAFDRAASALVFTGGSQASERVGAYVDDAPQAAARPADREGDASPERPRRVQRRAPRRRAR